MLNRLPAAPRQHSQRFPATYIIHHPAVLALPRRRWIVDDARACTCVLYAVGVLLIVVLLHLPCLFWPWWFSSPDTSCLFAVGAGLCASSSLYCIFIYSVVPVLLRCWTRSPVGFWCFLFGVARAPVEFFVVLKCWSAIFRYNFLQVRLAHTGRVPTIATLLQLARHGCAVFKLKVCF